VGPQADDRRPDEERRAERRRINQAGVLEMLDQIDSKHDEAHKRIRHDLRALDQRLDDGLRLLADRQTAVNTRVQEISITPLDINKVVFTPRVVVAVTMMVLSISGAVWTINSSLRSDVRDILTRMATEQRVTDTNAKLLEQNSGAIRGALENNARELKASIDAVNKRQDLLTLQYNQLSEQLTKLAAQRER
jgi:flagellar capping protein FliD